MNILLWIFQVLLALLFLYGGGTKLVLPERTQTPDGQISSALLRFIGVCEVLGGLIWYYRVCCVSSHLTGLAAVLLP